MVFYYIIEIELSILLELQKSLPAIPRRLGKERWRIDKLSAAASGTGHVRAAKVRNLFKADRASVTEVHRARRTMFLNETLAVNQEKGIFDL